MFTRVYTVSDVM